MGKNLNRMNRREFIDYSAKGTAAFIGLSLLNSKPTQAGYNRAKVIVVKHEKASIIETIKRRKYYRVNPAVAQEMTNAGIKQLTGIEDLGEAWKSLFPAITNKKKIGIKVNTIGSGYVSRGLSSHPEVAFSIANGLTCMQIAGQAFPEENIIIWDRSDWELEKAGFTLNKTESGVKCYGTRRTRASGLKSGYDATAYNINGSTQYVSKILTDEIDYLINLCLLKDHSICGITLSMKNHYGSVHKPNCNSMHGNACNPAIPQINTIPDIRQKQVLCISDAVYGIRSGGPNATPQIVPNTMLFSQDTVALDTIGAQLLLEHGMASYKLTRAKYIANAASSPYNLGINDLNNIDVQTVENPHTGIKIEPNSSKRVSEFQLFQNYPNPFNAGTAISYRLMKSAPVKLSIFNVNGKLVRNLIDAFQNSGYHRITWDGTTTNGEVASSGVYFAQIQSTSDHQTIRMQLVK